MKMIFKIGIIFLIIFLTLYIRGKIIKVATEIKILKKEYVKIEEEVDKLRKEITEMEKIESIEKMAREKGILK
ncbi:MAG: hypothetical protein ABIM60_06305 [candidate division WOR-3 bacterium]